MRSRLFVLSALLLAGSVSSLGAQARQTPPPPKPTGTPAPAAVAAPVNDLTVTVTYTGKGVVDATHNIIMFLFTDPAVGPNSNPIGPPQIATKNGETVKFTGVNNQGKPVYVFAIYNEKGTYVPTAPPPAGIPIGLYSTDPKGTPTSIMPGPKAAVKITFTGAKKFGQ